MTRSITLAAGLAIVAVALSGCGGGGGGEGTGLQGLFTSNRISSQGPDEFAIVPNKPLEAPPNYSELPEPQLGARNLVDPVPEQDAVAALGGRPGLLDSDQVRAGEGALLAATNRRGTAKGIRDVLAKEDAQTRQDNGPRLFERWFGTDTYFRTYESQTLEARAAAERARQRGIRTPTVGPPEE